MMSLVLLWTIAFVAKSLAMTADLLFKCFETFHAKMASSACCCVGFVFDTTLNESFVSLL